MLPGLIWILFEQLSYAPMPEAATVVTGPSPVPHAIGVPRKKLPRRRGDSPRRLLGFTHHCERTRVAGSS